MNAVNRVTSLALLTDLYELTMAFGYWRQGMQETEAVFNLFFRRNPFEGGYTIACGLQPVIEFIESLEFCDDDLEYLAGVNGSDGQPLFNEAFLTWLGKLRITCDIDAIPEGTPVFPREPLLRVRGPLIEAQILESALLNTINFQSLIATKATRIVSAAEGDPVVEFGLRRAHGIDGGLSASRASWIGGCSATSNVLAAKIYGIPPAGTHAHSWIMAFDDEPKAFEAWAKSLPNNSVFLVDTYDSLNGVRNAARAGAILRESGHALTGIRLDSGDLAWLSGQARRILDEAGFRDTSILASNELDEHLIASLKQQKAAINVWGIGTRLVTAADDPALGGVYKLTAIRSAGGEWKRTLKLSEQAAKITTPGILAVRRFEVDGQYAGDMIYDETLGEPERTVIDPVDPIRRKSFADTIPYQELLVPIFRAGKCVYEVPPLPQVRVRVQQELAKLHPAVRRFHNPHQYPAGLAANLHQLQTEMILAARKP